MYPPKSSTDPEMFYGRSTDREMAARRRRRTCVQAHVCVVADTFAWLYQEKPTQEKQVAMRGIPDAEPTNHT